MAATTQYQRLPSVEVDESNRAGSSQGQENVTVPAAPVVEVVDAEITSRPVEHAADSSPPTYLSTVGESSGSPSVTAGAPPSYSASTSLPSTSEGAKLPTYEEYEKLHENDEEFDTNLPEPYIMPADYSSTVREGVPAVTVVEGYELALGDDLTFCSTFFVSFFLNWIGFLLSYIFSRTIAGKCGSTSGFGLGLIKLAFYLRAADTQKEHHTEGEGHGTHGETADSDQSLTWVVWLMILFGWFTFVRGITLYIKYKRQFASMQGGDV